LSLIDVISGYRCLAHSPDWISSDKIVAHNSSMTTAIITYI